MIENEMGVSLFIPTRWLTVLYADFVPFHPFNPLVAGSIPARPTK
jgi:hypothetical protein